jgi:hypothetical protein
MGICNSFTKKSTKPVTESVKEKPVNPHSIISGQKNATIIKSISEINGDMVKIDTCINSTIIIMDHSAQVIINDCKNCSIFIAPSRGSVMLRKSEGINIISASSQFRCSDVINSKAAIYSNTQPTFEKTKSFSLGCFFFYYVELLDRFHKASLSVWDNCWSEFHDFTPSSNSLNLTYFNPSTDSEFIQPFLQALKSEQATDINDFKAVPYTKGLSLDFLKSYSHAFVIIEEDVVFKSESHFYDDFSQDNLESLSCSLVRTLQLEHNDPHMVTLKNNLKRKKGDSDKSDKLDFFNNLNKSHTNISKDYYVLLWLANDQDNFGALINFLNERMEIPFLFLMEEDLGKMPEIIKKIFKNFESLKI